MEIPLNYVRYVKTYSTYCVVSYRNRLGVPIKGIPLLVIADVVIVWISVIQEVRWAELKVFRPPAKRVDLQVVSTIDIGMVQWISDPIDSIRQGHARPDGQEQMPHAVALAFTFSAIARQHLHIRRVSSQRRAGADGDEGYQKRSRHGGPQLGADEPPPKEHHKGERYQAGRGHTVTVFCKPPPQQHRHGKRQESGPGKALHNAGKASMFGGKWGAPGGRGRCGLHY